ncbi:MAG: DUF4491 family protein [Muribaculaceae bacterium]|nr:DUF4491 family protein [Muribaculaceae bacterium]
MTEYLSQYHLAGLLVGLAAFLIIGLFHPLVIKGEYYFGRRCRWWFLAGGLVLSAACIATADIFWSALLGVAAFSCFWSIKEVDEQVERVRKGWFPANPKRMAAEKKNMDSSEELTEKRS